MMLMTMVVMALVVAMVVFAMTTMMILVRNRVALAALELPVVDRPGR